MNENDIERRLQEGSLAQPSANLDERMRALFEDAAPARPHLLWWPVPVWLMAAACLVCAATGFGVRSLFVPREKPSTVVYVFPPSEALTRFLMGERANRDNSLDLSLARIQVITQPVPEGNKL